MRYILIAIAISLSLPTFSQDSLTMKLSMIISNTKEHGMQLGDQMPGDMVHRLLDSHNRTITSSEFRGKLLVLDFWHQYCAPCVTALPELSKLQEEFKDRVSIIPVTFQSSASVQKFLDARKKKGVNISLQMIVEDTLLRQAFPHIGDPFEVWINEQGKVLAFTGKDEVNRGNLIKMLDGGSMNMVARKRQMSFSLRKPFLVGNNGGTDTAFTFRSMVAPYIDSVAGFTKEKNSRYTRLFYTNRTLPILYREAYFMADSSLDFLQIDRLGKRIDRMNPDVYMGWERGSKLSTSALDSFRIANLFCYELTLPNTYGYEKAGRMMKQDIDRYFDLQSSIITKKMKCLILKIKNIDKVNDKKEVVEEGARVKEKRSELIIGNRTLGSLVSMLNAEYEIPWVVDETGYKKPVSMEIKLKEISLLHIKDALDSYGLELVEEERELPVLRF